MDPAAYRRVHDRIVSLVTPDNADTPVATCPGWTVKDLVAHLASFFATYDDGGMKAFGPGWGDRTVAERRDLSLQECFDEWDRRLADADEIWNTPLGSTAVSDALAHEQDIRTALGRPGARDDEGIPGAATRALKFMEGRAKEEDLPPLRIVTEDLDVQLGEGAPAATLKTSSFELFRIVFGRRTADQVRSLDWDGDPEPWAEKLFVFGPTKEVVEK